MLVTVVMVMVLVRSTDKSLLELLHEGICSEVNHNSTLIKGRHGNK